MTDLTEFDVPFNDMEQRVVNWVTEALELRHGSAGDPEGPLRFVDMSDGLEAVDSMLRRARARSDRVDFLLANATRAKFRAQRAREAAEFAAENRQAEALKDNRLNRVDLFVSKEERMADASLDSLTERRNAHAANRLVSVTQEAYEIIKDVHWQLNAIRNDLRTTVHALQFESTLER